MWIMRLRACSQLLLQVDTLRDAAGTRPDGRGSRNSTKPAVAVYLALLKSYEHMGAALLR